jgi:hypothetical protein
VCRRRAGEIISRLKKRRPITSCDNVERGRNVNRGSREERRGEANRDYFIPLLLSILEPAAEPSYGFRSSLSIIRVTSYSLAVLGIDSPGFIPAAVAVNRNKSRNP